MAPGSPPRKPDVDAGAFSDLDLRVGRVVAAAAFPAARKPSLRLRVDFGSAVGELETSAQVTNYAPDELVGRLVVGAINLGVKRIAGLASQFLVLGALEADGTVHLLEVPAHVPPGSVVA